MTVPVFRSRFHFPERGAWLRFFGALVGLALAFSAALFSTVASQSGNVMATALFASLALLLAGAVGLTVVPYLARRVAIDRWWRTMEFDVTREGGLYLGVVLLVGIAALNTGNNLLFILVAAMLSAVVVSGLASVAVLRGLELSVRFPVHVFARSPVTAQLSLHNRLRLPSFSISVTGTVKRPRRRRVRARAVEFTFPWWRPAARRWFRIRDLELRWESAPGPENPVFAGAVYFPYLPGRSSQAAAVPLRFAHRGRYRQDAFGLVTRFPFSFLKRTRRIALGRELIVYPPIEMTDASLEVLPLITGEFEAFVRGRGCGLYRIREYQPEDSCKHVDWKATAKTNELKVREFTREDERKLRVVFDNPCPGDLAGPDYEKAVELAASLAWHFVQENAEVSFSAPGYGDIRDLYDFLQYLAEVQAGPGPSVLDSLAAGDDYHLILTARPRGTIPTRLWACSYVIFLNGARANTQRESGNCGIR
jgi:uncharacterized protein (DUF58 family)